jgi:hypothetical protein
MCCPIAPVCTALNIGEIERGETNVTLQTLKTLADTFHVRITDLLGGL